MVGADQVDEHHPAQVGVLEHAQAWETATELAAEAGHKGGNNPVQVVSLELVLAEETACGQPVGVDHVDGHHPAQVVALEHGDVKFAIATTGHFGHFVAGMTGEAEAQLGLPVDGAHPAGTHDDCRLRCVQVWKVALGCT